MKKLLFLISGLAFSFNTVAADFEVFNHPSAVVVKNGWMRSNLKVNG